MAALPPDEPSDMENLTDATYAAEPVPLVTGLFPGRDQALQATRAVLERGYEACELNLVMSEETCRRDFSENLAAGLVKTDAAGMAPPGAMQVPNGSVMVPGLDIVVSGPLAQALDAGGIGGVAGGIAGALAGWGVDEEYVREYDAGIRHGRILLAVQPHSEEDALYLDRSWKALHGQAVHH